MDGWMGSACGVGLLGLWDGSVFGVWVFMREGGRKEGCGRGRVPMLITLWRSPEGSLPPLYDAYDRVSKELD